MGSVIGKEQVIDFSQVANPGNPPAATARMYYNGTNLVAVNSAGSSVLAGGGGGTPGGSSGDIQYNNSGAFGGVTIVPAANGGVANLTTAGQGVIFSTQGIPFIGAITAINTGDALGGVNQIRYLQITVPFRMTISKVVLRVSNAVASSKVGAGLFDATGATKIVDSGVLDKSIIGVKTGSITPVTINAGVYLAVWSSDSATGGVAGIGLPTATNGAGLMDALNTNATYSGTAANTWSNSTGFPSSLGALTNFINLSASGIGYPTFIFQP